MYLHIITLVSSQETWCALSREATRFGANGLRCAPRGDDVHAVVLPARHHQQAELSHGGERRSLGHGAPGARRAVAAEREGEREREGDVGREDQVPTAAIHL